MKWYFASRTHHQKTIKEIATFLKDAGHTINSHWIEKDTNAVQSGEDIDLHVFAEEIELAIQDSDVFVLISDPEGTDMFVELGIALASHDIKSIYIVGEHGKRSVMQHHPDITHVNSIEEIFDAVGVEYSGFKIPVFI